MTSGDLVPDSGDGWKVTAPGATKASVHTATQGEAIDGQGRLSATPEGEGGEERTLPRRNHCPARRRPLSTRRVSHEDVGAAGAACSLTSRRSQEDHVSAARC